MRILIAVVHHWNPQGGGRHQSLGPDPQPRVKALQELILGIKRLGLGQYVLNIRDRSAEVCNNALQHSIDLCLVTDGENHVMDHLDPEYAGSFTFVSASPRSPRHLGFEAQRFLAECVQKGGYDLVGYMEDDLVIHDPLFFHKIYLL